MNSGEITIATLVERLSKIVFADRLPDNAELVAAAVTAYAWPLEESSPEMTVQFHDELLLHLRAHLAVQSAAEIFSESDFPN